MYTFSCHAETSVHQLARVWKVLISCDWRVRLCFLVVTKPTPKGSHFREVQLAGSVIWLRQPVSCRGGKAFLVPLRLSPSLRLSFSPPRLLKGAPSGQDTVLQGAIHKAGLTLSKHWRIPLKVTIKDQAQLWLVQPQQPWKEKQLWSCPPLTLVTPFEPWSHPAGIWGQCCKNEVEGESKELQ